MKCFIVELNCHERKEVEAIVRQDSRHQHHLLEDCGVSQVNGVLVVYHEKAFRYYPIPEGYSTDRPCGWGVLEALVKDERVNPELMSIYEAKNAETEAHFALTQEYAVLSQEELTCKAEAGDELAAEVLKFVRMSYEDLSNTWRVFRNFTALIVMITWVEKYAVMDQQDLVDKAAAGDDWVEEVLEYLKMGSVTLSLKAAMGDPIAEAIQRVLPGAINAAVIDLS